MATRTKRQVDSNEVREWAQENDWRDELDRPVAMRGRMPSGLIEAYNKANARYNKEYVPIPRPVRSDYRDVQPAAKATKAAEKASTSRGSRSGGNAGGNSAGRQAAQATAPAVVSTPVEASVTDDAEARELEAVMAAFASLPADKKNGRPVLVTTKVQTLRYV